MSNPYFSDEQRAAITKRARALHYVAVVTVRTYDTEEKPITYEKVMTLPLTATSSMEDIRAWVTRLKWVADIVSVNITPAGGEWTSDDDLFMSASR